MHINWPRFLALTAAVAAVAATLVVLTVWFSSWGGCGLKTVPQGAEWWLLFAGLLLLPFTLIFHGAFRTEFGFFVLSWLPLLLFLTLLVLLWFWLREALPVLDAWHRRAQYALKKPTAGNIAIAFAYLLAGGSLLFGGHRPSNSRLGIALLVPIIILPVLWVIVVVRQASGEFVTENQTQAMWLVPIVWGVCLVVWLRMHVLKKS